MRTKLPITPNLILDETPISAEGALVDADRVRERLGKVEAIGGWTQITASTVTGSPRAGHSWADNDGTAWAAVATHQGVFALTGTTLYEITAAAENLVLADDADSGYESVTTVSGSAVVTITRNTAHGLSTGRRVRIAPGTPGATANGVTLNGVYAITVTSSTAFTVTGTGAASSTGAATGAGYPIRGWYLDILDEPGTQDGTDASTVTLDNFGELLIANRRGGKIRSWRPNVPTQLLTNDDFTSATGWTASNWTLATTSGSFSTPNTIAKTTNATNSLSQTVPGITIGRVYRLALGNLDGAATVTVKNGATTILTTQGDDMASVVFEAVSQDIVISANGVGLELDWVRLYEYERLSDVESAPEDAEAIFVTDERHLVALGPGLRVRNTDTEVITDWTPSLADQAEDIDRGSGTAHLRGVPVAGGYLLLSDDGATLMRFTGSPELPWRFDPIGTNCGLIGPQAVAAKDGMAVWMSNSEQFYLYDGQGLRPLDCGLLRDVFDNLNRSQARKVVAGINGRFDEVWISYPDSRDGATENSRTVVYNLRTGRWLRHSFGRSAWLPQKVFEYPIGVTSAGLLVYHENGTSANGAALGALVETAPFDLGDGETLMEIQKVVIDIKNQTGDMTLTVKTRLEPRAAEVSYGPHTVTTTTQKVDVLALGRQTSVRFASAATSSEWRLGSVILDVIDTGDRD